MLVETSRINLVLGEIFYRGKVGTLELGAPQVGALEICVTQIKVLALSVFKCSCPPSNDSENSLDMGLHKDSCNNSHSLSERCDCVLFGLRHLWEHRVGCSRLRRHN